MFPQAQRTHDTSVDTGVTDALQLTAAVSGCGVGLWSIDDGGMFHADSTVLSIWGRTLDELSQGDFGSPLAFVHPEDREHAETVLGASPTPAAEALFRVVRPDGSWRWVLCRRSHGGETREAAGGIALDLTTLRRGENDRLRVRTLETVATLAARLAHDFNNLLFAILGNATLALGTMQLPLDHPIRESLREIERAANRASEIVQRMSAFARPVHPRRQLVKLSPLVEVAVRGMQENFLPQVNVRTHAPITNEPSLLLDPKLLQDLIISLLSNAIHASEGRSTTVDVDIEEIDLGLQAWFAELGLRTGRYIELRVHDAGPGMDAATLERASEPFFSTRPKGGGAMGLGLSIAQGIVKSHGGALRLESELEHGTTVRAYFPVP